MESNSKIGSVIATLVIGLVVGGLLGWFVSDINKDKDDHSSMTASVSEDNPNASTKAADLRASLVSAGTEHMDLVYTAVSSALQGDKSAEADKAALIKNGHDLGDDHAGAVTGQSISISGGEVM